MPLSQEHSIALDAAITEATTSIAQLDAGTQGEAWVDIIRRFNTSIRNAGIHTTPEGKSTRVQAQEQILSFADMEAKRNHYRRFKASDAEKAVNRCCGDIWRGCRKAIDVHVVDIVICASQLPVTTAPNQWHACCLVRLAHSRRWMVFASALETDTTGNRIRRSEAAGFATLMSPKGLLGWKRPHSPRDAEAFREDRVSIIAGRVGKPAVRTPDNAMVALRVYIAIVAAVLRADDPIDYAAAVAAATTVFGRPGTEVRVSQ